LVSPARGCTAAIGQFDAALGQHDAVFFKRVDDAAQRADPRVGDLAELQIRDGFCGL
jgi:hypothetical protein